MNAAVYAVYVAVIIYGWLIVARALLSWFHLTPGSPVYGLNRVLVRLTEPYLAPFRRFLPVGRFGSIGIDWSFPAALLVLFVVLQVLARL